MATTTTAAADNNPIFVFGLARDAGAASPSPPSPKPKPTPPAAPGPLFSPPAAAIPSSPAPPPVFTFGKPADKEAGAPAVFVFGSGSSPGADKDGEPEVKPPAVRHVQSRFRHGGLRKGGDRKRHVVRGAWPLGPEPESHWCPGVFGGGGEGGFGRAGAPADGDPQPGSPRLSTCSEPVVDAASEEVDDGEEELAEDVRAALKRARGCMAQRAFGEALEECVAALSAPPAVLKLARGLRQAWERSERERALSAEEEQNSLMARLRSARERADELKRVMREKESQLQKDLHLAEEVRKLKRQLKDQEQQLFRAEFRRRDAEADWHQERDHLRASLREARCARQQAPSREELVRQVAALECQSLKRAGTTERVATKKKLLLKWHPDKQASTDNAAFATQVMQELQNRPEWE